MIVKGGVIEALNPINDEVVALLDKHGPKLIYPPGLRRRIREGRLGKKLLRLAMAADCLRILEFLNRTGKLTDLSTSDFSEIVITFAKYRPEYGTFSSLGNNKLEEVLDFYRNDSLPFGYLHRSTMWGGLETCSKADGCSEKTNLLELYRNVLAKWIAGFSESGNVMDVPGFEYPHQGFGATYSRLRGSNVQLRPNVLCKKLQSHDHPEKFHELRVPELSTRLAYWELLELTRENGLQFSSSLRERHRLTQLQKLELEKFLDPGRQRRHLWPEPESGEFRPFPKTHAENPFTQPSGLLRQTERVVEPPFEKPDAQEPSTYTEPDVKTETGVPVEEPSADATQTTAPEKALNAEQEKALVVDAPIDANQIVFAPPGTGKTHALVKRLARLISEGLIENPSREVLTLSFSRAAVAEIVKRMDEESADTGNNNLRYFQISTFDSFAARSMTTGANPVKLASSYAKNIEMFTRLLSKRELPEESLEHIDQIKLLVVDEIQDLVGERARMTLAMMKQVLTNSGSVLLLGDSAQAIYDWQLSRQDAMTSAEFISQAKSLLNAATDGFNHITFDCYVRFQNERLLEFVRACREAIGDDGSSPDMTGLRNRLNSFGATISEERLASESTSSDSVAVLTRTNLEAYQLSKWCEDNAVHHRVERGASGRYWPGWLARICLGFEQATMSRSMLEKRWAKLAADNERASFDDAMEYLTFHGVYKNQQLDVERLSDLVAKSQPLRLWPTSEDYGLTISTIHRSKGLQFDRVAILDPEAGNFSGGEASSDNENARVIYVAATRAKSDLLRLSRCGSIFRRGYKKCSRKSWNRLKHFQLWDSSSKTNRFLLDGIDEFNLIEYMKTIKSSRFSDVHELIWQARAQNSLLEVIRRDGNWIWRINGKVICKVSPDLENTLSTFDGFLGYHDSSIAKLDLIPVVDVASVSYAWRGDREVEGVLGKARLALLPVVYGLALVQKTETEDSQESE